MSLPPVPTSTPSAAPRLLWVPITITDAKLWTSDLADYEAGWFWSLIFNSLVAEPQGYLPNSLNLWRLAGARGTDFWESHKSGALACWKRREVDGRELLYFPPLVELINKQRTQMLKRRQRLPSPSPSPDGDLNQIQKREGEVRTKTEAPNESRNTGQRTPLDRFIGG